MKQPITVVWQHKTKITYKHYTDQMEYEDADEIGKHYGYGKTIVIMPSSSLKNRLLKSIKDLKNGRKSHYPICCVLNYCIDKILNRPSIPLRYTELEYAVCTIHHRKHGKKTIPEGTF
jgi:hypothetical protein